MKTLVVIIPGAKAKFPPFLKPFVKKTYKTLGVTGNEEKELEKLANYLKKHADVDVFLFKWSGGITRYLSINPAGRELAQVLNKKPHKKIILFCKSLGGAVCEIAISKLKDKKRIKKIIYIATPHPEKMPPIPRGIEVHNVFSEEDYFLWLANKIYYLGTGTQTISGVNNIILKDIKHSYFNKNIEITYQNKKIQLYELYKKLILG